MILSEEDVGGLNVALNEAQFVGMAFASGWSIADLILSPLSLPEEGPPDLEQRVVLRVYPVARIRATLIRGTRRMPLSVEDLPAAVASFGGQAIYGWDFFDPDPDGLAECLAEPSLVLDVDEGTPRHALHLFQDEAQARLDLCFWFDELEIRDAENRQIVLEEFIAGGKRWWDGVYSGDPRTRSAGIEPLKG